MTAAALALGLLIGLTMGALGGGGSILAVPVLVFVLGLSAQEATTASLVIVGVIALVSSAGHARSGNTRWGAGLLLATVGVPASVLGTAANRRIDGDVLLLAFSALMLISAVGMLVRARAVSAGRAQATAGAPSNAGAPDQPDQADRPALSRLAGSWRLVVAGLGIGFLTGFLGVGGGFLVVPVLVVLLRTPMPAAVGTSLLVIGLNSAVGLAARAPGGAFDWATIIPFTLSAVAGSFLGGRLADRVSSDRLTVAFAGLLLCVGAYVAVQAVLGLT